MYNRHIDRNNELRKADREFYFFAAGVFVGCFLTIIFCIIL